MRRAIATVTALLLVTGCNVVTGGNQIEASGVDGQRNFDATGFDRVALTGPFDVTVAVGGQPGVRAEGDTGIIEKLDIRVEDGRLRIGLQNGFGWSGQGDKVRVFVTVPSLVGADISGSGDMRVGALRSASFDGSISGSGKLVIERIEVERAAFAISGSGNIEGSGTAREARVEIAGSGDVGLDGLQAETASISIAGSGDATIRASGTAAVNLVGSGDVRVTGGARCTVSKVGSGDVDCG